MKPASYSFQNSIKMQQKKKVTIDQSSPTNVAGKTGYSHVED
jgi:hypothetical protein